MFFPMVDEDDQYDEVTGLQKDDINSLAEYIYQIILGHKDTTPEDEDDDQAHFYHIKNAPTYVITLGTYRQIEKSVNTYYKMPVYPVLSDPKLKLLTEEVIAPPPEV